MRPETLTMVRGIVAAAVVDEGERAEVLALLATGDGDRLLTPREAADVAGRTRRTLRNWERAGHIHPIHPTPTKTRFSRRELLAVREMMAK